MSSTWLAPLLLVVLVLAAGLRADALERRALWADELFSAGIALYYPLFGHGDGEPLFRRTTLSGLTDGDSFWTAKAADQSPPLFELATLVPVALLGPGEWSMRAVSLFASVLLLALLARAVWRRRDADDFSVYLSALILFAVSVALVEYAREGRAYSLGVLFAALLSLRWYQRWHAGIGSAELPGWGEVALFVAACHTHYNLIVLSAPLLGVYAAIACRRRQWRALLRLAAVPLLCLPWVALSAHAILFSAGHGVGWVRMGPLEAQLATLKLVWGLLGAPLAGALIALVVLCVGRALAGRPDRAAARATLVDVMALLLPALLYLALVAQMGATSGIFHRRHFLFALPLLYLLAGVCLSRLLPRVGVALALAVAVWVQLPALARMAGTVDGHRETVFWAAARLDDGAPLLTGWAPNRHFYRYYLDRFAASAGKRPRQHSVSKAADIDPRCRQLAQAPQFGVVAHRSHREMIQAALTRCGIAHRLVDEFSVGGMFAQLHRRHPPAVSSRSRH